MRRTTTTFVALAATAAAVFSAAGGARPDARAAAGVRIIAGQPTEFGYRFIPARVHPGNVTFLVVNGGKLPHDFKIAGRKTRILKSGKVARLRVRLKKGSYPYLCTDSGHAAAGMKGVLRVR